jgi:hypothetical protein
MGNRGSAFCPRDAGSVLGHGQGLAPSGAGLLLKPAERLPAWVPRP